ncbi:hypothetical protein PSP88_006371, partial [Pseudomonas aeruginosa]|nr:hypothetical protein [Pseudomonas aeruginosa]
MAIWSREYTLEDLNDLRGVQKENINKHLDIQITEIGDDFLKGTMPVDERSKQPFGILRCLAGRQVLSQNQADFH